VVAAVIAVAHVAIKSKKAVVQKVALAASKKFLYRKKAVLSTAFLLLKETCDG
jgi:uncharacterized protein (UPF0333 family)